MEINSRVDRKRVFATRQELAEHLKKVGQSIAEDADNIIIDPEKYCGIKIIVEIYPGEDCTTIHYRFDRLADVRLPS